MRKKSCTAFIFLIFAILFESWTIVRNPLKCLRSRTDYEQVAKDYSPLLLDIVRKCPVDPSVFVPDTACGTRWLSFPTALHEALHVLNAATQPLHFPGRPKSRTYYLDADNTLEAAVIDELPRSTIIIDRTPDWFKEVDVRFKTYILDTIQDASKHGMFGLVEEFSAYRCSMEAYTILLIYMNEKKPEWLMTNFPSLLFSGNDAVLAYYELHMYMTLYLDCLKNQSPEQNEALKKSGVLQVMEQVDQAFATAVTRWNSATRDYLDKHDHFSLAGNQLKVAGQPAPWETRIHEVKRATELLGEVQSDHYVYRPQLLR
ncbi:MAG: hypothetical protein JST66_07435 [Bacteroidetes bacterium]|nr:hypothetical protein [Bacteroidota bacterium]